MQFTPPEGYEPSMAELITILTGTFERLHAQLASVEAAMNTLKEGTSDDQQEPAPTPAQNWA